MLGLRGGCAPGARFVRGTEVVIALGLVITGCDPRAGGPLDPGFEERGVTTVPDITWPYPFTEGEFLAAWRQVMPEAEAQQLVAQMRAATSSKLLGNAEGYTLMGGMLDLLATVSDDLALRVQQYRDERARAGERARRFRDGWWREQGLEPPELGFSEEELLAAFRKVMTEDAARDQVAAIRMPDPQQPGRYAGHHVSDITLDLVASVSQDLAQRVQKYRAALQRGIQSSKERLES